LGEELEKVRSKKRKKRWWTATRQEKSVFQKKKKKTKEDEKREKKRNIKKNAFHFRRRWQRNCFEKDYSGNNPERREIDCSNLESPSSRKEKKGKRAYVILVETCWSLQRNEERGKRGEHLLKRIDMG